MLHFIINVRVFRGISVRIQNSWGKMMHLEPLPCLNASGSRQFANYSAKSPLNIKRCQPPLRPFYKINYKRQIITNVNFSTDCGLVKPAPMPLYLERNQNTLFTSYWNHPPCPFPNFSILGGPNQDHKKVVRKLTLPNDLYQLLVFTASAAYRVSPLARKSSPKEGCCLGSMWFCLAYSSTAA